MNFSNKDWLDLVFQERLKEYGAFQIRRNYNSVLIKSVGITIFSVLLLPTIYFFRNNTPNIPQPKEIVTEVDLTQLTDIPVIEKPPPPPPPSAAPPPPLAVVKPQVKFVAPVVKKDENVPQETPPPKQDELKKADASTITKGDTTANTATVSAPLSTETGNGTATSSNSSGGNGNGSGNSASKQVFSYVEKKPEFPGGQAAMMQFIADNLTYPVMARDNGISGIAAISFIVNEDGSLSDFLIIKEIGGGCGQEAVRIGKLMPKWAPGMQKNQAVKVRFNLPIKFTLN